MRCMHLIEAGAYVLGALAPADRSAYQRHLSGCGTCREEVADLAGLPGLLSRLDEATAAAIAEGKPPVEALRLAVATQEPERIEPATGSIDSPLRPRVTVMRGGEPTVSILPALLRATQTQRVRSRRRNRWLAVVGALAAACLVLITWAGTTAVNHRPAAPVAQVSVSPPALWLAPMDAIRQGVPVTAVIGFWPSPHGGTNIAMSCSYNPAANARKIWDFNLVVYPRNGEPAQTVWSWSANPNDYKEINAHTTFAPRDIDRIEVQLVSGVRLLIYEMA